MGCRNVDNMPFSVNTGDVAVVEKSNQQTGVRRSDAFGGV